MLGDGYIVAATELCRERPMSYLVLSPLLDLDDAGSDGKSYPCNFQWLLLLSLYSASAVDMLS
jgi:hypothetical protein